MSQKFSMRKLTSATSLAVPTILLLAAAVCPAPAASQSAQAATATGHSVVVPVTVRDKKGALVENVQKADLTLTQDNRPQAIVSLAKSGGQPYRIGLLVDTSHTVSGALEGERKALDSFVDTVLPAGSKTQVFLIHFDREVELVEDFTGSREKLHHEIEDLGPTRQEKYEGQGPETTGDDRAGSATRHNGKQLYDAIFLACDELMKNKDGRKVLVVFSDGADRGSKDTLNDAVDAADHAGVSVYTIFTKGIQERDSGFQNTRDNSRGGTGGGWPGSSGGGYPGGGGSYPGGGGNRRQPEPRAANGIDGKKVMQEIATRTGGHGFEAKKREDLTAIYGLIEQELKGQFLLTYVPDKADNDESFHKLAVTTANKDWTVAAPEGFYFPAK